VALNGSLAISASLFEQFSALRPERLFASDTEPAIDAIWAIPTSVGADSLTSEDIVVGTLNADHSFSIDVSNSKDYVVVLVNSEATGATSVESRLNQIVGFAGFNASDRELIRMPVSAAVDRSVSLGTVTVDAAGSAISNRTLDDVTTEFSSGKSALTEYSRTNDVLKSIKNAYANNNSGVYYSFNPTFMFRALQSEVTDADFSNPASSRYTGYLVFINTNDPGLLFDKVCDRTTSVELIPPASISTVGNTTPVTQLDNATAMTSQSSTTCGGENCTLKAAFDLATVSPVDATTGKPVVYIPVVRVTRDGGNLVTKVEMRLKAYNATTGTWEDPADLTTLRAVVTNPNISLTDYSGSRRSYPSTYSNGLQFDDNGIVTLNVTGENWSLAGQGGENEADSVDISWQISGTSYRMEIRSYLPNGMQ
jgi:hypothetical protein